MKKKSKFGINSGNTFRLGSLLKQSRYNAKNQHCIFKFLKNQAMFVADSEHENRKILDKAQCFVDDGGLDIDCHATVGWRAQNVEYTLNKRKRWCLPAMIKSCIGQVKEYNNSDVTGKNDYKAEEKITAHMSLVEREIRQTVSSWYYNANIQNTCINYCDSTLPQVSITANHKYSTETDLREKGKCNEAKKYMNSTRAERARERNLYHNQHYRDVQRQQKETKRKKKHRTDGNPRVPDWIFNAHNPRHANVPNIAENQEPENFHDDEPRVHYEVCYPGKLLGSEVYHDQSHHRKFSACWGNHKALKKVKTQRGILIRAQRMYIKEAVLFNDSESSPSRDTSWDDLSTEGNSTDPEDIRIPTSQFSLGDALNKFSVYRNMGRTKKEKKKNHNELCKDHHPNTAMAQRSMAYHPKGSVVHIHDNTPAEPTTSTEDDFVVLDPDVTSHGLCTLGSKVKPTLVSLDRKDISETYLCSIFGQRHVESGTVPRMFVLDITDLLKIQRSHNASDASGLEHVPCSLFLAFEESKNKGSNPDAKQFRLHVEGDLDLDGLTEIQHCLAMVVSTGGTPLSIQPLVHTVINSITDNDHLVDRLVMTKKVQRNQHFTPRLISELQAWQVSCHSTKEAYHIVGSSPPNSKQVEEDMVMVPSASSFLRTLSHIQHLDYCDICYDNLVTNDDDGIDMTTDLDGLALANCQHWFCKPCWQQHLLHRIRLGDIRIQCPAYDCEELVTSSSILLLLPYNWYETHLAHIGDANLESSPQWKWCPNDKCGSVARLTTEDVDGLSRNPAIVTCSCGVMWCFACQQEAHWPSTCHQATAYFKMVKQKGDGRSDESDSVFYVQVRKCPFCRHPIEKNGGCQHMVCTKCRGDFCWECLGAWRDHGSSLVCPRGRVTDMTFEIDFERDVLLNQYYSEKAMELRRKRKFTNFDWQNNQASILAFRVRRSQIRRTYPSSFLKSPQYWQLLSQNIPNQYVVDARNFMIEGFYLLEHTYVILSTSPRRVRQTILKAAFNRLCFIIDNLQQLLSKPSTQDLPTLENRLHTHFHHGKECATELVHKLALLQKHSQTTRRDLPKV